MSIKTRPGSIKTKSRSSFLAQQSPCAIDSIGHAFKRVFAGQAEFFDLSEPFVNVLIIQMGIFATKFGEAIRRSKAVLYAEHPFNHFSRAQFMQRYQLNGPFPSVKIQVIGRDEEIAHEGSLVAHIGECFVDNFFGMCDHGKRGEESLNVLLKSFPFCERCGTLSLSICKRKTRSDGDYRAYSLNPTSRLTRRQSLFRILHDKPKRKQHRGKYPQHKGDGHNIRRRANCSFKFGHFAIPVKLRIVA